MTQKEALEFAAWIEANGWVVYGERILVYPDAAKEKIGSIYVPDAAQEKPQRGYVLAVGLGITDEDRRYAGLRPGDKILYKRYTKVTIGLPDRTGKVHTLEEFHVADIYFGYRPHEGAAEPE